MPHGPFLASPGAALFGWNMLFDITFLAAWTTLETTGNTTLTSSQQTLALDWMAMFSAGDQVLLLKRMVTSIKQLIHIPVILGLSHKFLQMRLLGFIAEQNQNILTSEDSHPFSTITPTRLSLLFCIQHLPFLYNTYAYTTI